MLNTFPITEHLGCQPAADRLLVNLIAYAAAGAQEPLAALPDDFGDMLARIGYTQ